MSLRLSSSLSTALVLCLSCGGESGQRAPIDAGSDKNLWPRQDIQAQEVLLPTDVAEVGGTETIACIDNDGDGYGTDCPKGPDCNDAIKTCHVDCETDVDQNGVPDCEETDCPGTEEIPYNGIDDDCDPFTPDADFDKDGYAAFAMGGDDCDDKNDQVHPGAKELCGDWLDNNCDGFPIPGSNQPECPQGQMCNLQTWQCEDDPDCNGCPMGQICQNGKCEVDETCYGECPDKQKCTPESGLCVVVGCLEEGCPEDEKSWACNPYTGYCYITSCDESCPKGKVCNPETGLCDVDQDCGGACLMNETCDQNTGTCGPTPNCPNDFCWGWPDGMWRVEGPDTLYYIDQYEYPNLQGEIPLGGLSEAQWECSLIGKRLCTLEELASACDGVVGPAGSELPYAQSLAGYDYTICNTEGAGVEQSGAHSGCKNQAFDVWDLVGNLAEWTAGGALFGGSYDDGVLGSCSYTAAPDQVPPEERGFRCCLSPQDDLDGDGFTAAQECDESDADVHPGAKEVCNEIDDDCNGLVDDAPDQDGDGFNLCQEGPECDKKISWNPEAEDHVGDEQDQNCDGVDGVDADGDGQASVDSGGMDCNDSDNQVYYDCKEKECGEDGCGGVCGDCSGGTDCVEGHCGFHGVGAPCIMDSSCDEGLTCFDWPGGYCLLFCDQDSLCPAGSQCMPLLQNAQACFRSCQEDEDCRPEHACKENVCICPFDCEGKECGDDGCGGSCGECPVDTPYCVNGICLETCDPSCLNKECGDDGCGGICGNCGFGQYCTWQGYCADL